MASSNEQFLYLLLTHGGSPTIDWNPICDTLNLEKGAASKRWSRLRQAMGKGEKPADSSYNLLWLLLKHSDRDKVYDWEGIAAATNSTKGACAKRWSRLKQAFEQGDAAPATPGKAKPAPVTPRKTPAKVKSENSAERTPTTASKRKRTPAKTNVEDVEEEDDKLNTTPKRTRSTPTAKPRPKNGFRASDEKETVETKAVIKYEHSEGDDVFSDAPEQAAADLKTEEVCKSSVPPPYPVSALIESRADAP
ncbi:hypothetical protein SVAN01_04174 [Stagonosporopsis vannaccii]|nr:hypothetical protein SVAN01_04174 [Stagonosporopsis vannaccii]